jgi:hypothetical protein
MRSGHAAFECGVDDIRLLEDVAQDGRRDVADLGILETASRG